MTRAGYVFWISISPVESLTGDSLTQSESIPNTAAASDSTDLRTKAELWNEVKMLSTSYPFPLYN